MHSIVLWLLVGLVYSQMDDDGAKSRLMEKVFVYGSLKRGEPNHHLLADKGEAAVFEGYAKTASRYPLVIASKYNIPYLLNTPGRGKVVEGELYKVDGETFRQLDALEGHPKYYERSKIPVLEKENETEAWAYLLHDYKPFMDTLPYLESYSSKGSHGLPFVPREARVPGDVHSFAEVKLGGADIAAPNNSASFDVGSPAEKRHLVFVYGTLKSAQPNYGLMTNRENGWTQLIAWANTKDKFPLVVASRYNIPFLLDKQGVGKQVDGELYCVDDSMLNILDAFESYPELYNRKAIPVMQKNTNVRMMAWAYLLHDFNTNLLHRPLLQSYSANTTKEFPYEEPEEMPDQQLQELLLEVKENRTSSA